MKTDKANELFDFLKASRGHYIRYTDYESKQWVIKILNDEQEIQSHRDGYYEITIDCQRWAK